MLFFQGLMYSQLVATYTWQSKLHLIMIKHLTCMLYVCGGVTLYYFIKGLATNSTEN